MPKYEVLRPIEHDGKLYLPKNAVLEFTIGRDKDAKRVHYPVASYDPKTMLAVPSGTAQIPYYGDKDAKALKGRTHNFRIPVDASGVIELTKTEAAEMVNGQVAGPLVLHGAAPKAKKRRAA